VPTHEWLVPTNRQYIICLEKHIICLEKPAPGLIHVRFLTAKIEKKIEKIGSISVKNRDSPNISGEFFFAPITFAKIGCCWRNLV
jgi:hypothetical protein